MLTLSSPALSGSFAPTISAHVASLPRPGVLEVRYEDRAWPGPSPFVDAPVVRYRFEAEAAGGL